MKEIKNWNGEDFPIGGELFIATSLLTKSGAFGGFLCYCVGEDFDGGMCFEVLCPTDDIYDVEEFTFDSYFKTDRAKSSFSIVDEGHLDIFYQRLDY